MAGALNDPARIDALAGLRLLDTAPEEPFDRLTRLAARVLKAPVALVSLVDDRRQFFKSASGLAEPWATRRETPLTHSFCQHVVVSRQPLVVPDATIDDLLRDNLAVGELGVVAYLGVPLVTDGNVVGSFCVIDTRPRGWSAEDLDVMRELAASVMTEAALRVSRDRMEEQVRVRTAELAAACRGLETIESRQRWLISELDHRVKNTLARVSTVVDFTRADAPSMDAFVAALTGRIESLAGAHQLLSRSGWAGIGLADLVGIQLAPYAATDRLTVAGPAIKLTAEATESLSSIVHELVTNAAKYGALSVPRGRVDVQWNGADAGGLDGGQLVIEWRETDGPPVVEPTHTSFGTRMIRELICHELGGEADLVFEPEGVRCRLTMPLARVLPMPV